MPNGLLRSLVAVVTALGLVVSSPVVARGSGGGHGSHGTHSGAGKASHAPRPDKAGPHFGSGNKVAGKHSAAHGGAGKRHQGGSGVSGSVKRNAQGKIARSAAAKGEFKKSHPCPSTGRTAGACPGYVIDHKQALKRGGADRPDNMQWQTTAAAKAKDKSE